MIASVLWSQSTSPETPFQYAHPLPFHALRRGQQTKTAMETPIRTQRLTKGRYSKEEKEQLIANLDLEGVLMIPPRLVSPVVCPS